MHGRRLETGAAVRPAEHGLEQLARDHDRRGDRDGERPVVGAERGRAERLLQGGHVDHRELQRDGERFRWLDERKMVVPAATAIWKTQSLGAKSTDFFTATAPTTECRDFYLEVRFVHDSTRW